MEQDVWDAARRERGGHQREGKARGGEKGQQVAMKKEDREKGWGVGVAQWSPSTNDNQINEVGGTKGNI